MIRFVFRFIVLPIRMKKKNAISITPHRVPTVLEDLSPEMQEFLGQQVRGFRAEGFEAVSNVKMPDATPNAQSVLVLMVNRQKREVAVVTVVWALDLRTTVFWIRTDFSDGTALVTGVNPRVAIFPRHPRGDPASFPWVKDAATLCEAHRRRLERSGRAAELQLVPAPGEEAKYLDEEKRQSNDWFVASGYIWRDEAAGVYRKTWKGTFLMTWKAMEPIKRWRVQLRDRRSRRLWRELGMATWSRPAMPGDAAALPPAAPIAPADSSAPTPVVSSASDSSELQYEPVLKPGEARCEHADGVLVVRIEPMRTADVLSTQIGNLQTLVVFGWILVPYVIMARIAWQFSQPVYFDYFRWPSIAFFLLAVIFFFSAAWSLITKLARWRRASVVWASPEGLRFANAPARRQSGWVDRGDIELIRVVFASVGFWSKRYRLEARLRGSSRHQPLFVSDNAAALNEVKVALGQAMGISVPPVAPQGTGPRGDAPMATVRGADGLN